MSRRRTLSPKKKIALAVTAVAVAGSGAFALAATSNAANVQNASTSTVCQGLATALGNNESFIAAQKANPDAQSAARIANREAVVAEIKRKQEASGCQVGESIQAGQSGSAQSGGAAQAGGSAQDPQASQAATTAPATTAPANNTGGAGTAASGQQVCKGSTVTLSGEGGAPAASSNQFPAGTTLKVTNLDNNKSTTVKVTSVSGSCVLLNNAAFEQVREPGKFLIRRALIEKVG
ncbi:septal ring lytic transglycosylase RlpA family protein [Streptomyces sp. NPDC003758]|uniref:Septal ring lytic transglycosylase RlpA family protein n=1 Tax=Streptomyces cynarae TaxID=2981134 RepID=A0ABY6E0S7_9ACTN|nr:septal ring lytic transglycosylase RlpA family protein [Streptomyces cynarae]UXY19406.1 septal ring lytic transglycosylase RlpA family protein [Streptomyces cynarae]